MSCCYSWELASFMHSLSNYRRCCTSLIFEHALLKIVHKLYCNISMMLWSPSSGKKREEEDVSSPNAEPEHATSVLSTRAERLRMHVSCMHMQRWRWFRSLPKKHTFQSLVDLFSEKFYECQRRIYTYSAASCKPHKLWRIIYTASDWRSGVLRDKLVPRNLSYHYIFCTDYI